MDQKPVLDKPEHAKLERNTFLLTLVIVSIAFLALLQPFWGAIFWGIYNTLQKK